jgi:hypothetical protein
MPRFGRSLLILTITVAGCGPGGASLLPSAPASTPSPAPASASPLPAATVTPTVVAVPPIVTLTQRVLAALDKDVVAARSGGVLSEAEEGPIIRALDSMSNILTDQHVLPEALLGDQLITAIAAVADAPTRTDLGAKAVALGELIRATPFVAPLAAGTHYTERYLALIVLKVGAGWEPRGEDQEGFAIGKGPIQLAFHRQGPTTATAAALKSYLRLSSDPAPATVGAFAGFVATVEGQRTLYIDSGLRAHESRAGDKLRVWVVDFNGLPLTIVLFGPPADVDAALAEVETVLATLQGL